MSLQKSHSGMSRYQQDLPHRTVSGTVRWSLCCLLVVLLCYCFMQPTLLFADSPFVTQEIRYDMPEAGEVSLIWGINGWAVVPEENRPAGTVVKGRVMHTPMVREGDTFVAQVQVPAGATMDYGFLITKTRSGAAVYVWEANGEQDYHTIATEDGVIEVQTRLTLAQDRAPMTVADSPLVTQEIRYDMPEAGEVFLVWGINGWAVVPEENRPDGTVVKDSIMYTPMVREGDIFVTKLQVPSGVTIDYVFQITNGRKGAAIEVWDANGDPKQDYHTVAVQGGVAEVQASPLIGKQVVAGDVDIGLPWIGLILLAGVCVVLCAPAVQRRLTAEGNTRHFLTRMKNLVWEKRLVLILTFISVLYLSAINLTLYAWGDDAHYIIVGKSIATGQGLKDIHLQGNPTFKFPIPGFPLLLAPIIYFFDYNLLPMKIFVALVGVGMIYLVRRFFSNLLDDTQAILLMLFVGVSPQIVSFSHQVMSEIPYLFLFFLSLLYIKGYGSEREWFTWTGLISALGVAAVCLTKSIGFSVALACIPYLLWDASSNRLQGLKKACFLLFITATVWLLFNFSILSDIPYTDHFLGKSADTSNAALTALKELMAKVLANLGIYLTIVPETIWYHTFRMPFRIFTVFSWLVVGYGFLYCLFKERSILEYYIFFYVPAILLFETSNISNMRRFLVPIIPLIIYYFMKGIRQITLYLSDFLHSRHDYGVIRNSQLVTESASRSVSIAFITVISILTLLNLNATVQASVVRNGRGEMFDFYYSELEKYKNMATWAKEHIPPESIVMTRMIHCFHFWSHGKVVSYPYLDLQEDAEQLLWAIYETNADYITIDTLGIKQTEPLRRALITVIEKNPAEFQLVYQDGHNMIYHILSRARSAMQSQPLVSWEIR